MAATTGITRASSVYSLQDTVTLAYHAHRSVVQAAYISMHGMLTIISLSSYCDCGATARTNHSIHDMATQQLCEGMQNIDVRHSSTHPLAETDSLIVKLHDRTIARPEPKDCGASNSATSAAASDAQRTSGLPGRLPPLERSASRQMSAVLGMLLKVPEDYLRPNRHLLLGWPAPSREVELLIFKRYTKKYRLEHVGMSHANRFATLLQRRLGCPEITAERCLFNDVSDPDPRAAEVERSFDCIAIATTLLRRHRSGPKFTEDQFRWLVLYFGRLPSWYYHYEPSYLM